MRGRALSARLAEWGLDIDAEGPKSYLDIGCAYGGFLIAFAERGYDVTGIELDEKFGRLGRLNLEASALPPRIFMGNFLTDVIEEGRQFDLITCNDVIEHVADPAGCLRKICAMLKPGGAAYIASPNKLSIPNVRADVHFQRFGLTLLDYFRARAAYTMYSDCPDYTVSDFYEPEWYVNTAQTAGAEAQVVYDSSMPRLDAGAEIAALYAAFSEWEQSQAKRLDPLMEYEIRREFANYTARMTRAYEEHVRHNAAADFYRTWIDPLTRVIIRKPPVATRIHVHSAEPAMEAATAQSDRCEESHFTVLAHYLPQWLNDEIRTNRSSIGHWGSPGDLDAFRRSFPSSRIAELTPSGSAHQIVAVNHVPAHLTEPWRVLSAIGERAARHLVILVPFRQYGAGHAYTFDENTIATHLDPNFALSACTAVEDAHVLLVYSRPPCLPGFRQSGRDAELHAKRDLARLEQEVQRYAYIEQDLRREVERLRALHEDYAAENRALLSRAAATAFEVKQLRRLNADLQKSLSWRVTAPLRIATKPLFAALSRNQPSNEGPPDDAAAAATGELMDRVLPSIRNAESLAVLTCAVPFRSALNQRPISLARRIAARGTKVLFVAWQWSLEEQIPDAFSEVAPGIFQIPLLAFQSHVEKIAAASTGKGTYVCTLPSAGLVQAAGPLRAAGYHIHYDVMDDWEEFHRGGQAPWFSVPLEREMVRLADTVSTVSQRLCDKFGGLRTDIAVIRNGYDPAALRCEQFVAAAMPLAAPKRVGYFGHLSDAWFDWDAVLHAAGTLKNVEFELIGSGLSESTGVRIRQFPNIRLRGAVPQGELHRNASKWWAALIPFQRSALSAAVDPLKVYEYLHIGLPVIVTGVSEIAAYPLVQYAADRDSFAAAIDRLNGRPDEQAYAETEKFLTGCVWEQRLAELDAMMQHQPGLAALYAR